MLEEDKKLEEDFEIVEQGDADAAKEETKKTDVVEETEENEEELDDQSLASGGPVHGQEDRAETNAQKRRKRKKYLKEKLDQKDALIRAQSQQIKQMNERLSAQERRTGLHERAFIDKAASDAKMNLEAARQAHANALSSGDAGAVTEALDIYYTAKRRVEEIDNLQQQVARVPQNGGQQTLDAAVINNTNNWMSRNSWFKPDSNERDSRIAKVIDDEIAQEGFDPRTPAYWQELDRRLKDALPHRFAGKNGFDESEDDEDDGQSQSQQQRQKRAEPRQTVGSNGNHSGLSSRKKVTLSRERIQAIKDAGYWENPAERNKMVKQFMEWDRKNVSV